MTRTFSRSLSLLLAAAFTIGLWVPTLSAPQARADTVVVVSLPELA